MAHRSPPAEARCAANGNALAISTYRPGSALVLNQSHRNERIFEELRFYDKINWERIVMNKDNIEGGLRKTSGEIEEMAGRATKNKQMMGEGIYDQAAGVAQNAYGQVKDVVASGASAVGDNLTQTAAAAQDQIMSFETELEKRVQKNPLVAVAIALGIGFLLGKIT
jgi:uncharacterized protein YjbJ (UPF0337 family)